MGVHSVYEALVSGQRVIERVHIAKGSLENLRPILEAAEARNIPLRRENREALDRMAGGQLHQGVVAIVGVREYQSLEELVGSDAGEGDHGKEPGLFVVLDSVQDPHNLGAVIRTAETAGASGVVVTQRRSAPLTAAVSRASAGAMEHLPVARVTNLVSALKFMKQRGVWIVGFDAEAELEWTDFDYSVPVALVLGGEHRGIRRLVRENCDVCVRLPVRGRIQSLNVSVTAGIALYEVLRQRSRRV